jgi:hypothetical protein
LTKIWAKFGQNFILKYTWKSNLTEKNREKGTEFFFWFFKCETETLPSLQSEKIILKLIAENGNGI